MKPHHVARLVLCKSIGVDGSAGGMILTGVFHHLSFPTWPTQPQRFYVYTALYGGLGEGTIQLEVKRLETEQLIYRFQRWYAVPDPALILHMEISVKRCVFPAPGRYGLSLRFDGQDIAFRPFDIRMHRGER